MPCIIKNPANLDLSELEPHVQGMYDYFDQKIGFNKPPTMIFDSDPGNQANVLGKTAYYDPSTLEIHVYSDGRHPKDMLRSIAHELIHHKQNLDGRLDVGGYSGPGYYLENDKLRAIEHEAMLEGNKHLREYEDNLKLKESNNMSLKEWKNNELSGLLMKRFGILKEEKKPDADGDGVPDWADKKEDDDVKEANEGMDYKRDDELEEDSREDQEGDYEDNRMSDDDHIKAIEHHLAALRKDKNYDDDHEELEETVSKPMEENNDGLGEPGDGAPEDAMLPDDVKESKNLKENIKRILKKNKKIRLRVK